MTTYNGGFRFDGPPRLYCGTDERYGEPRAIPASEADREFITYVHNMPFEDDVEALLVEVERMKKEKTE